LCCGASGCGKTHRRGDRQPIIDGAPALFFRELLTTAPAYQPGAEVAYDDLERVCSLSSLTISARRRDALGAGEALPAVNYRFNAAPDGRHDQPAAGAVRRPPAHRLTDAAVARLRARDALPRRSTALTC
jgi:hypothetical protein